MKKCNNYQLLAAAILTLIAGFPTLLFAAEPTHKVYPRESWSFLPLDGRFDSLAETVQYRNAKNEQAFESCTSAATYNCSYYTFYESGVVPSATLLNGQPNQIFLSGTLAQEWYLAPGNSGSNTIEYTDVWVAQMALVCPVNYAWDQAGSSIGNLTVKCIRYDANQWGQTHCCPTYFLSS